jgi:hypothetical protein
LPITRVPHASRLSSKYAIRDRTPIPRGRLFRCVLPAEYFGSIPQNGSRSTLSETRAPCATSRTPRRLCYSKWAVSSSSRGPAWGSPSWPQLSPGASFAATGRRPRWCLLVPVGRLEPAFPETTCPCRTQSTKCCASCSKSHARTNSNRGQPRNTTPRSCCERPLPPRICTFEQDIVNAVRAQRSLKKDERLLRTALTVR